MFRSVREFRNGDEKKKELFERSNLSFARMKPTRTDIGPIGQISQAQLNATDYQLIRLFAIVIVIIAIYNLLPRQHVICSAKLIFIQDRCEKSALFKQRSAFFLRCEIERFIFSIDIYFLVYK